LTFFLVKYAGGLMMAESVETYCSLQEKYSCCILTRYIYIAENS